MALSSKFGPRQLGAPSPHYQGLIGRGYFNVLSAQQPICLQGAASPSGITAPLLSPTV